MLNTILLLSLLTMTDSKLRKFSSDEVDSKSWNVTGKSNGNNIEPKNRLDMISLSYVSNKGLLTSIVNFKLSKDHTLVLQSKVSKLADKVAKNLDCDTPSRIFRHAGKHEESHKEFGLDMWYKTKCSNEYDKKNSSNETFTKLTRFLDEKDQDGVIYIEPEYEVQLTRNMNDPNFKKQKKHYDAINLREAWDITTGNPNVVVQVLDTGIDMSHPDLKMNIWTNPGEICDNGIDDDGNGFVDDCHGYNHADDTGTDLIGYDWHGTHCGGTIAADNNNGVGVSGVAGGDGSANSGAKLMISVGFGKKSVSGFAEALVYGADMGAQISSNSWGYTGPGYVEKSILDAIDYYNAMNGIVVFSAGNENSKADYYPGYYDGTIAVSAVKNNGIRASWSNYGDWIDISAPGVSVYSTKMGSSYGGASGTSMACPHVAGVLALGIALVPDLSKDELIECMYSTAKNIDSVNKNKYIDKLGSGMVDAEKFLMCISAYKTTPRPTTITDCSDIKKKKCKKNTNCEWKNGKCSKITKCDDISKKRKCKKMTTCVWKKNKCILNCSSFMKKKKCRKNTECLWHKKKCKNTN